MRLEPLRVLVIDAADTRGRAYGAQRVILDTAEQLADDVTYTAAVTSPTGPYPEQLAELGVEVAPLPLRRPLPFARSAVSSLLDEGRFDLVHTHDLRASAIGRPTARQHGLPSVTSYHENLLYDHLRGLRLLKRRMMINADWNTADLAARGMCVSQAVADEIGTLQRLPAERLPVVGNGIDPAAARAGVTVEAVAAARAECGAGPDDPIVVLVGSLTARKGQSVLLEAAPAILQAEPATRFVFVGDGPDRAALEQQAARLGVAERCWFAGFRTDAAVFMGLATVVVVPSLGEAFGLTALEAAAQGKPVVASEVGGLPEIVIDGETGRLVPPGESEALASAVSELLTNAEMRARLGVAGLRRCETRFALSRVAARILRVYHEVLA